MIEETWRCQGVEWRDGTQSQACILRIFPQYPFSPLSRPTQLLRAPFSLPHGFFSPVSLLFRREPRSPARQPRMASLQNKKGSSPQVTCLPAPVWGEEGTYTGSLVLGTKPFSTELALDLPGKEGRALTLQLGNSSHHSGCGQTWLATTNSLGLQDTCTVVTP